MNSKKKNIRKTSGTCNRYKPGQLVTIDNYVFRITRELCSEDCLICWYRNCNIYMCLKRTTNKFISKTNLKHKG